MNNSSRVDLPSVGNSASQQQDAVRVVIRADGAISVGRDRQGQPQDIGSSGLAAAVQAAQAGSPEVPVLISADKPLPYDSVMQVYSQLKQAGVQRIALAVQPVAKVIRALAMSILSERMGTPMASTLIAGASTALCVANRPGAGS